MFFAAVAFIRHATMLGLCATVGVPLFTPARCQGAVVDGAFPPSVGLLLSFVTGLFAANMIIVLVLRRGGVAFTL
jgi:hypothetical protein